MTSTAFSMSLAVTEPVAQPVQPQQPQPTGAKDKDKNKDKKKEEPENGLAYRAPAWGLITIKAAGTIVRTERVPIAQLGATANLQAKIGSGTSYQFTLDPLTGALRDVAGTGQPSFTPERVKMLEGVADSIFGAAGAARKALADPEPDSRLSLLQKQTREVCEEARLVLFEKCKADTKSGSCELALKACP